MTTYTLSGVTRDARGATLASVTVDVFDEASESFLGTSVSDSGGNYSVTLSASSTGVFAVGYLVGSPDRAGTTLNNLVPVATSTATATSTGSSGTPGLPYNLLLALTWGGTASTSTATSTSAKANYGLLVGLTN